MLVVCSCVSSNLKVIRISRLVRVEIQEDGFFVTLTVEKELNEFIEFRPLLRLLGLISGFLLLGIFFSKLRFTEGIFSGRAL